MSIFGHQVPHQVIAHWVKTPLSHLCNLSQCEARNLSIFFLGPSSPLLQTVTRPVVGWPDLSSTHPIANIADGILVVLIVFIDGFLKRHTPGSLLEPAQTYLFPSNWLTLPLSFGLLMSPWGGHSVFPNIYRDMRHPHKFNRAVKVTFTFTVSFISRAGHLGSLTLNINSIY